MGKHTGRLCKERNRCDQGWRRSRSMKVMNLQDTIRHAWMVYHLRLECSSELLVTLKPISSHRCLDDDGGRAWAPVFQHCGPPSAPVFFDLSLNLITWNALPPCFGAVHCFGCLR